MNSLLPLMGSQATGLALCHYSGSVLQQFAEILFPSLSNLRIVCLVG